MLIFIIILGFIFGNFTTSFYYRIGNNKPVNGYNKLAGQPPHCSVCKHPLRFYEYLPILSMIFTKFSFKCNYCSARINPIYTILECSTALSFLINYLLVSAEQPLILLSIYTPIMILMIALRYSEYVIPNYLLWCVCFLGVLYRTILDGNFYTWLLQITVFSVFVISQQRNKTFDLPKIIINYASLACACCWLSPLYLLAFIAMHQLARLFRPKEVHLFCLDFLLLYGMILFAEMRVI